VYEYFVCDYKEKKEETLTHTHKYSYKSTRIRNRLYIINRIKEKKEENETIERKKQKKQGEKVCFIIGKLSFS